MVIFHMRQMAGINYMVGGSASSTDPKKVRSDKRTIINVDRPSNESTVDRNMDEP